MEKEIDISVFTKLLDPNNKFVETVPEEIREQKEAVIKQQMLDAIGQTTGIRQVSFADESGKIQHTYRKKNGRLTMAERDKLRPKGFSV